MNSAPDSNHFNIFNLAYQLEDNHERIMHFSTIRFKVDAQRGHEARAMARRTRAVSRRSPCPC